jgi:N-glycosylase/DNA lyase
MERSLFWNAKALTDNNAADAYYDMSKTLAQIAMALKNNEYKKLVLTELQECFL